MPRVEARVINCTARTKSRLNALRGRVYGMTEEAVLSTLLSLAESLNRVLVPELAEDSLDTAPGIPRITQACR